MPAGDYNPDIVIAPSETIREMIDATGFSPEDIARWIGWDVEKLDRLLHGLLPITDDVAATLGDLLPYPSEFWLNLERNYRRALARQGNDK